MCSDVLPSTRIPTSLGYMPAHQPRFLGAFGAAYYIARTTSGAENTPTYWITGKLSAGPQTDSESWAIVTWAWRALYTCTTKTHREGTRFDFKVALLLTFRYVISRTLAHGRRWKLWFNRQVEHAEGIKIFPFQHRKHELIEFEADSGYYHTHPKLPEILRHLSAEMQG